MKLKKVHQKKRAFVVLGKLFRIYNTDPLHQLVIVLIVEIVLVRLFSDSRLHFFAVINCQRVDFFFWKSIFSLALWLQG
jgi:hypothetical protein